MLISEHPRLLVPLGCSSLRRVTELLRGPRVHQLQVRHRRRQGRIRIRIWVFFRSDDHCGIDVLRILWPLRQHQWRQLILFFKPTFIKKSPSLLFLHRNKKVDVNFFVVVEKFLKNLEMQKTKKSRNNKTKKRMCCASQCHPWFHFKASLTKKNYK